MNEQLVAANSSSFVNSAAKKTVPKKTGIFVNPLCIDRLIEAFMDSSSDNEDYYKDRQLMNANTFNVHYCETACLKSMTLRFDITKRLWKNFK